MIIAPGSTSVSVNIQFLDDSGLPLTGKVAADFPSIYYSVAGNTASTQITLSDLTLITTAHANDNTAGGIKERAGSAGVYRLDLPNNAVASAGEIKVYGEASGKHVLCEPITVRYVAANTVQVNATNQTARDLGGTLGAAGAGLTALGDTRLANLDAAVSSRNATAPPTAAANASAVRTELATELARVDVAVSTRNATTPPTAANNASAVRTELAVELARVDTTISSRAATGAAMTLTSGERTAIANEVEAQIIDDTDSEKVLQAIVDKIAAANPSLDDLTLGGIASAVRSELATELARLDAAISSRMATFSYTTPPTAASNASAVRTELATELGRVDTAISTRATPANVTDARDAVQSDLAPIATDAANAATNTTNIPALLEAGPKFTATALENAPAGEGGGGGGSSPEEIAAAVWDETRGALVVAKASLITVDGVTIVPGPDIANGATITRRRADSWSIPIAGLGDITDAVIYFTVKTREADTDDDALLMVKSGVGLTRLNRLNTGFSAGDAAIVVTDSEAGDVTVAVEEAITAQLTAGGRIWAVKIISAGNAETVAIGEFTVTQDAVEAIV